VIILVYRYIKNKNNLFNGLGKLDKNRPPKIRIVYSKNQKASDRIKISGSNDVYHWFKKVWSSQMQTREEIYVLLLNRNNQILGYQILSSGGITGTVADVRLLYAVALKALATSVILAHNHPSGNLQPSETDKVLTQKIKDAGNLMDITLLDHLIITREGYFSFADEHLL
jgi:DNA repair protein RadC